MKKNLKIKLPVVVATVLFGFIVASLPAMACSNLGADKHLGVVQNIDAAKGELTVIDAESQQPIVFIIDAEALKGVKPNDTVIITFKSDNGRLRVEHLKLRSA